MNNLVRSVSILIVFAGALSARSDVLYNNLANSSTISDTAFSAISLGDRFTSGSSILSLSNVTVAATTTNGFALGLYSETGSGSSVHPGTLLGSLGTGTSLGNGQFSFGGGGVTLAANTPYWILMTDPSSASLGTKWAISQATANAGSTPSTAFANSYGMNGNTTWMTAFNPSYTYEMSVVANPVPEPTTLVALGLGSLALLRRRRKA